MNSLKEAISEPRKLHEYNVYNCGKALNEQTMFMIRLVRGRAMREAWKKFWAGHVVAAAAAEPPFADMPFEAKSSAFCPAQKPPVDTFVEFERHFEARFVQVPALPQVPPRRAWKLALRDEVESAPGCPDDGPSKSKRKATTNCIAAGLSSCKAQSLLWRLGGPPQTSSGARLTSRRGRRLSKGSSSTVGRCLSCCTTTVGFQKTAVLCSDLLNRDERR